MNVNLIQFDIAWNDPKANISKLHSILDENKLSGLVVLPEMFTTGFSFLSGERAIEAQKIGDQFLSSVAKKYNFYICGSLPLISNGDVGISAKPTNTLRLYGPSGHIADYSKIHLFTYDGEDKHYQAGNDPVTVDIEGIRVTFAICYDLRFPDLFAHKASDTDLYVIVANWPAVRQPHWECLTTTRAIENQAYVAAVNRCGKGGTDTQYLGGSRIISPKGEVLAEAEINDLNASQIITTHIDPKVVRDWRAQFPALIDRKKF